jgi:PST family polysaccharide transporter
MLNQLRDLFKSADSKRLIGNFMSLSVLQGANLLLPLVTFPYLVRVLGIEKFGLISFALATVAYFEILTDYGFDFSATRQISIHRDDKAKLTSIYNAVLTVKMVLSLFSFIFLTILVFSIPKLAEFYWVYYFTFLRVIGKSLFPEWFFLGLEKMKIVTYLNLVAKIIFTLAIFFFVKSESDLLLVPIFNSLGFLVIGIVAILQVKFSFGVDFKIQSKETLIEHVKDGWHIFLSRIYVNVFTTTNTFLLGMLTNNIIVGYYAVASKIIEAITSIFGPANDTLYPYMSKLFHDSVEKFNKLVKQINVVYSLVAIILFLGAFVFGKQIIILINGSFDNGIWVIYSILVWKILLSPYGPFYTLVFINQGRKAQYLQIVKYTLFLNLVLVPISIVYFSGIGMAVATLVVGVLHIMLFLKHKIKAEVLIAS